MKPNASNRALAETHKQRSQFAEAVATSLSGVRHLYRQVDLMNQALIDSLRSAGGPLAPVAPFRTVGVDNAYGRMTIRDSFSTLFQPGIGDDSEAEELATDEESDRREDRETNRVIEIDTTQPTLALSVCIASRSQSSDFEPCICYAMIGNWWLDARPRTESVGSVLSMRPYMFRRMMLTFPPTTEFKKARRVHTPARAATPSDRTRPKRRQRVSFQILSDPAQIPLCDMTSPESVVKLASAIAAYFQAASATPADAA